MPAHDRPGQSGCPFHAFHGHCAADRLLRPEHLAAIPAQARAFHFGSCAMVVQPVGAIQRALVEREHRRSMISYDPNIRTNVEPDPDIWRATLHWMQPRTHLLKASGEDLELLYPARLVEDIAETALAAGTTVVVVTRGGKGPIASHAAGRAATEPVPVVVIDTVGAGDTFQAALLTWLAERGAMTGAGIAALKLPEIADALRFAASAAAITCGRRGADLPRRAELG